MSFAIKFDGAGWRRINSADEIMADEYYSETQPITLLPGQLWAAYQSSAKMTLETTSSTVERIAEGIALGTCAMTNPDVVAFMKMRRDLRAIVSATEMGDYTKPLPTAPYPAGT
jgi:hypothetical protein